MEIARRLITSPAESVDRRTFIGGSDAAAVLGLSRWKTPIALWAEKTGLIEPDNIDDRLPVKLGKRLEQVVAELFTEQTGKEVRLEGHTIFDSTHPFLGANIDRWVVGEDAVLECKTVSAWKAKEFDLQELPQEHIVQCVHYMAVTGAARCYLAVLIGNQDFKIKEIERDDAMIKRLVDREVEFWTKYVEPKVMPQMITKYDDESLLKLFPNAITGPAKALDDRANQLCETLQAMKQDSKSLDGQIDQMENELKVMLKENECGATSRWLVTWKNQLSKRIDTKILKEKYPDIAEAVTKELSSRVLRYKEVEVI